MPVFKCKMCGGSLDIKEGQTICECEYCGTKQTIPLLDNDKKNKLYERANRLRFNNEFDRAYTLYQEIINDFPIEVEAYWGLLLCKYGIEYVEDPYTHKRIPTCHRSSFDSIFDDECFDMVMENAEPDSKLLYREEAKIIEEIRKRIIELSNKEEPYDIFICYKETDENGNRTIDSVIAQDVYDRLVEKAYRVFFSRISLEDKLGKEYEPYIFAALNTSKVMLVFGTKYECFNAVWVKNEWSRYLQLIAKGEKKTIIPCYKDIDAYDMPKEFKHLQAQDMGKVGAMQDLLRGIDKIIKNEKQVVEITNTFSSNNANIQSLLTRISIFLEDGDWDNANQYCEKVLDIDPKNGHAYLGKLLVDYKLKKPEDLNSLEDAFEENNNYKKIVKFGDENLKKTLKTYIENINNNKEEKCKLSIYEKTTSLMNTASSEDDYLKVAESFKTIINFKDSKELTEQCLLKAQEFKNARVFDETKKVFEKGEIYLKKKNYDEALKIFESVGKELETIMDFSKTKELLEKCDKKIEEINTIKHSIEVEKQLALEEKKKKKNNKKSMLKSNADFIIAGLIKKHQDKQLENKRMSKRFIFGMITVIVISMFLIVINREKIDTYINDNKLYKEAILALEEQNDPNLAKTKLVNIKNKDCTELIEKITISYAQNKYLYNLLFSFIDDYGEDNKVELIILACQTYLENNNNDDLNYFLRYFADDEELLTKIFTIIKNNSSIFETANIIAFSNSDIFKNEFNKIITSNDYIKQLSTIEIGDIFYFGAYEQDYEDSISNSKKPIAWIVIAKEDDKILLMSKDIIDGKQYNEGFTSATWEKCTLRKWLNDTFINIAFSSEEKNIILNTTVTADKNPDFNTSQGNDTIDKIFLLSIEEINNYFTNGVKIECSTTEYAKIHGVEIITLRSSQRNYDRNISLWWLRTKGINSNAVAIVSNDGYIYTSGHGINDFNWYIIRGNDYVSYASNLGVRPAMWISLGSSNSSK